MKAKVSIDNIKEVIDFIISRPQRANESKNSYYKYLNKEGLELSRTTLQYIDKAREFVNDDNNIQAILEKYIELQRERNKNSKKAKKSKKSEQIEMEIEKPAVHIVKDEIHELANDIPVSELSVKDKKELAMYAIDQYYFFLKQLTGVI